MNPPITPLILLLLVPAAALAEEEASPVLVEENPSNFEVGLEYSVVLLHEDLVRSSVPDDFDAEGVEILDDASNHLGMTWGLYIRRDFELAGLGLRPKAGLGLHFLSLESAPPPELDRENVHADPEYFGPPKMLSRVPVQVVPNLGLDLDFISLPWGDFGTVIGFELSAWTVESFIPNNAKQAGEGHPYREESTLVLLTQLNLGLRPSPHTLVKLGVSGIGDTGNRAVGFSLSGDWNWWTVID